MRRVPSEFAEAIFWSALWVPIQNRSNTAANQAEVVLARSVHRHEKKRVLHPNMATSNVIRSKKQRESKKLEKQLQAASVLGN